MQRVSFRLSETTETISKAKLTSLAREIKSDFGGHPTYSWDKGKILCLYTDKKNGYYFQIYAQNISEGESLIKKVISLNKHTFESDFFRSTEPLKSSVNKPTTHQILGKPYRKKRWRPTAKVHFQYAQAVIHGLPNPVVLVDYSGTLANPLVKAV